MSAQTDAPSPPSPSALRGSEGSIKATGEPRASDGSCLKISGPKVGEPGATPHPLRRQLLLLEALDRASGPGIRLCKEKTGSRCGLA